jgi:purine-nucleoside phosphorylase
MYRRNVGMSRLVDSADVIAHAADTVKAGLGGQSPQVAVVLGSGLGKLTERLHNPVRVSYADIPGFHIPTVPGHAGELVAGMLGGTAVLLQSGRFHMYEGHAAFTAALPVRVFAALGIGTLVVTNAAGGIRRSFSAGSLMLISDHLNLTGRSPLEGAVLPGEVRFPDMSVAYDADLRSLARTVAREARITLQEGVYAGLLGPTYETPAEVKMLERMGADAVGMSTVVEVIAARALGMRCLGISLITNPAAGSSTELLSHAEVMATANEAGGHLADLITGIVAKLPAM